MSKVIKCPKCGKEMDECMCSYNTKRECRKALQLELVAIVEETLNGNHSLYHNYEIAIVSKIILLLKEKGMV